RGYALDNEVAQLMALVATERTRTIRDELWRARAAELYALPVALMLLEKDATVITAHSRTADLAAITQMADVLVVAAGRPELVTAAMVRPGAVVIDVGINRFTDYEGNSRLVGDVDFDSVREVAAAITPVPRGVGPMTVTMLLANTVQSYKQRLIE
ncbi:MAG: hypothetical protein KME03_16060, partial [Aphanocapsa lilacina HA4352-LM1]|nr:hypothetical protein [Aphanocapsa lilacina HA4352-LM1]